MLCLICFLFTLTGCINSTPQGSDRTEQSLSWENRLTTLFLESDDAGLTLEDLTFFGTPVAGLLLEDAISIAEQNGFVGTIQPSGDGFSFQASFPDKPSPYIYLYQTDSGDSLTWITYKHTVPAGQFWGRDETDAPIWVGIRDIYTYNTLENVLTSLKYSNSAEIVAAIREILSLPSKEALAILCELHTYGFCCETSGYSVSAATDRLTEWHFWWTATNPESQKKYEVEFRYLVANDCFTSVGILIQ